MTAEPLILAVDQGTSSTKCLLVDAAGTVVSRAAANVGVRYPQPGWVEQSAEEIWRSVVESVRACLAGHDPRRVVGVGLSNQRESALVWQRRTGEPIGPVLGWQDQRTVPAARRLRARDVEAQIRARTGLPLDPMFSALKAQWLLDEYDPRRDRARRGELCLGTLDAWLIHRMTGTPRIEIGNASRTQLFDVFALGWAGELLDLFEVPRPLLPEVVASAVDLGPVRLPGLPAGVPLRAVLGDSHAALFAHGAFTPGAVKATYGTGTSVMGLVADATADSPGLCRTIAWQIDRPAYAAEGNIRASGAVLVWLAGVLDTTPDQILRLADNADAGGTMLVPAFGGLGAPWWDDTAVAVLSGLSLGTGRAHLARAAVEAIAHQVCDVLEAFTGLAGQQVDCLFADGGGSISDLLMQIQADLGRTPVLRASAPDGSALGVAQLAGLGAGLWDLDSLARQDRKRDLFQPSATATVTRQSRLAWREAVRRSSYHPSNRLSDDPSTTS
jgi:glycerol kinase